VGQHPPRRPRRDAATGHLTAFHPTLSMGALEIRDRERLASHGIMETLMADGAGKLDRLARLRNLRSGMKAKAVSSADERDTLDLDVLFDGEEEGADTSPAPAASDPVTGTPPPSAAKTEDSDPESLSAYFEALGIVPDSSKIAATSEAPSASAVADTPDPAPAAKGRDVDIRDRWADPVREDDRFLASFAGEASPAQEGGDTESFDSIIGSFDDADEEKDRAEPVAPESDLPESDLPESDSADPESGEPDPAAIALPEEPDTPAGVAPDIDGPDDLPEHEADTDPLSFDADDPDLTEFGTDIDIDAFEREIALAEEKRAAARAASVPNLPDDVAAVDDSEPEPEPASGDEDGAPLSITFDAGRAATLAQVSARMGCSVDDIVVTALDWYLDALFGEDGQLAEAEAGE